MTFIKIISIIALLMFSACSNNKIQPNLELPKFNIPYLDIKAEERNFHKKNLKNETPFMSVIDINTSKLIIVGYFTFSEENDFIEGKTKFISMDTFFEYNSIDIISCEDKSNKLEGHVIYHKDKVGTEKKIALLRNSKFCLKLPNNTKYILNNIIKDKLIEINIKNKILKKEEEYQKRINLQRNEGKTWIKS